MNYEKIYNAVKYAFMDKSDLSFKSINPDINHIFINACGLDLTACKQFSIDMAYNKTLVFITGASPDCVDGECSFLDTLLLNDKVYVIVFIDAIKTCQDDNALCGLLFSMFNYIVNSFISYGDFNIDSIYIKIRSAAPFVMSITMMNALIVDTLNQNNIFRDVLEFDNESVIELIRNNTIKELLDYCAFSDYV